MKSKIAMLVLAAVAAPVLAEPVAHHDDGSTTVGTPTVLPAGVLGDSGPRGGGVVYSNTVQTGSRFNPGLNRVAFDDVNIPAATLGALNQLAVCKVTVGIRRLANAPATDVLMHWATLTPGPDAPDTELDSPGTLFQTVSLPANGAASVTTLVTVGASGGPTLFTVNLSSLFAGFGSFAIGLGLSDGNAANGWRLTSGPSANANVFWQFDPGHLGQPNDEGAFNFGAPPNPNAGFYLEVEGTVVPTPGAAALLGIGGLAAFRRRRTA